MLNRSRTLATFVGLVLAITTGNVAAQAPDAAAPAPAVAPDVKKVEPEAIKLAEADKAKADAEKKKAEADKKKADADKKKADADKKKAEPDKKADADKKPDVDKKADADADKKPADKKADADKKPAEADKKTVAVPTPAGPKRVEAGKVSVEAHEGGWIVSRVAETGETACSLKFWYDGFAPRVIEGSLTDGKWTFGITEKMPDSAVVSFEFTTLTPVADKARARAQLSEFLAQLGEVLHTSSTDASKGATDREIAKAAYIVKARAAISELLKKSPLSTYSVKVGTGRRAAPAVILAKGGLNEVGSGQWEPTDKTEEQLAVLWGDEAVAYQLVLTDLKRVPQTACLGDTKALGAVGTDADEKVKAARRNAFRACLKAFVETSNKVLADDAIAKNTAAQSKLKALVTSLEQLSTPLLADKAKVEDYVDADGSKADPNAANARRLAAPLSTRIDALFMELPATPAALAALRNDAFSSLAGVRFVAALMSEAAVHAAFEKKIETALGPDWNASSLVSLFTYDGVAKDLFKAKPARPRFFVSTGVAATHLQDRWKLALPVLVSICFSTGGCETKAMYNTKSGADYVSLDLGIKTVFLGDQDPRERAPSFLLGLGFTPLYATHFSLGMNAFENPQTSQANMAFYLSVTLDVINGKDILGELGIGKPQVERVGAQ